MSYYVDQKQEELSGVFLIFFIIFIYPFASIYLFFRDRLGGRR